MVLGLRLLGNRNPRMYHPPNPFPPPSSGTYAVPFAAPPSHPYSFSAAPITFAPPSFPAPRPARAPLPPGPPPTAEQVAAAGVAAAAAAALARQAALHSLAFTHKQAQAAALAAQAALVQSRRKKKNMTPLERWEWMLGEFTWMDVSDARREEWFEDRTVWCVYCHETKNGSKNFCNIARHELTEKHKINASSPAALLM